MGGSTSPFAIVVAAVVTPAVTAVNVGGGGGVYLPSAVTVADLGPASPGPGPVW